MISKKSATNYIYYNGLLLFLSVLQYNAVQLTDIFLVDMCKIYIVFLFRNYLLLFIINNSIKNKKQICENNTIVENYPNEFNFNVVRSTFVEMTTYYSIVTFMSDSFYLPLRIENAIYFVPFTFYYEVVFDFFHYWSHRFIHTNKYLYKKIHKHHHAYNHPIPIITFYQEPLDLIITNSIPTVFTLALCSKMSLFEFNLIQMYKSYIEIGGHCGREVFPTSSFVQFIWLPRYFGIELYSEDHDFHHSHNNCNYSKRFSLWDKVFGTYVRKTRVRPFDQVK